MENNEQQPGQLTAKQIAQEQYNKDNEGWHAAYWPSPSRIEWAATIAERYAAQETATKDQRVKELEAQLSEVTRQRDESEVKNETLHLAISRKEQSIDDLNNNYKIIERQRDEANVLLRQYVQYFSYGMAPQYEKRVEKHLSRLSSGDIKPISMWISVEDRLPEIGQPIYIHLDGETFPGAYDYDGDDIRKFWDANDNPVDYVRLWTHRYVPAPPESLTDKK